MIEIISFIVVVLGISLLIIIHELGHFLAAKRRGLLVEEFGFGYPPRLWAKKIGETLYSINWIPFGGFVKIHGYAEFPGEEGSEIDIKRSFSSKSALGRAFIIFAGVLMNFLLAWILISFVFMIGIPQSLLVAEVAEGSIAEAVDIQRGDQILGFSTEGGSAFGGESVSGLVEFLDKNGGKEVILTIKRGDAEFPVSVVSRLNVPKGEGNLGVALVETGLPKTGFFQSFTKGLMTSLDMIVRIFLGFIDLIVGVFTDISILEKFVGPVGIVSIAIETTKLGIVHFVQLLAFISLNLVVLNLLPIPALDGCKLIFLLIEKIKGSPIPQKIEMAMNGLGFLFLMFLLFVITARDILTLF